MKYSCDHCPYESDKKANYLRHLNRKFKCYKNDNKVRGEERRVRDEGSKVTDRGNKVTGKGREVTDEGSKVTDERSKVTDKNDEVEWGEEFLLTEEEERVKDVNQKPCLVCLKCNKSFSKKSVLSKHQLKCNGLSSLQCETCHKFFSCKQNKYEHKRNVLCHPPSPPPETEPSEKNALMTSEYETTTMPNQLTSLTNNTTTNHSHNNNQITTNSNNNTINNIIHYNAFGDEGIEQLGKFLLGQKDDSKIIERMRQIGKKKLYGVREMQNDIFFNPDNPEGFSIIKPDKYGSRVRVRNSEGEFEYMEFSDVRDPLFNYMEKYVDIYNHTRNKYNVKFRDPRERRILYDFFKIMNDDLDIYLGEDLKDDLNIRDESSSSSEDDEGKKYKQFDKVSLDNLHTQTKKFYKCKKGEFVLKEKMCID